MPALIGAREASLSERSYDNLVRIARAARAYATEHAGRLPPDLGDADEAAALLRPFVHQETEFFDGRNGERYLYLAELSGFDVQRITDPDRVVFVFEPRPGLSPSELRSVAFLSGRAKVMSEAMLHEALSVSREQLLVGGER